MLIFKNTNNFMLSPFQHLRPFEINLEPNPDCCQAFLKPTSTRTFSDLANSLITFMKKSIPWRGISLHVKEPLVIRG